MEGVPARLEVETPRRPRTPSLTRLYSPARRPAPLDGAGGPETQEKRREMAQTLRFEGMSLQVRDVARSVAFYRDMLGFAVDQSRPAFALLRLGAVTLGLLRTRPDGVSPDTVHLELTTDDLDALYTELRARGVSFHEPPHDAPWERTMATYDPDGYKVEFAQGRRGHNQPG